MHFAMPPRKTSRPPPYAARNQSGGIAIPPALKNLLRSRAGRLIVGGVLGFFVLIWMLSGSGGTSRRTASKVGGWTAANIPKPAIGSGPPVVVITTIDPKADPVWIQKIKSNREEYAKKHGTYQLSPPARCDTRVKSYTNPPSQATSPSSPPQTNTPSATPPRPGRASPAPATP